MNEWAWRPKQRTKVPNTTLRLQSARYMEYKPMAKIRLSFNGIQLEMDAKSVPAFLASMGKSGTSAPVKKYIGEKDIAGLKAANADELVLKALALQDGIHTRYSGLNDAIRTRFNVDPIMVTGKLAEAKKITIRPTKGGVVINLKK